MGLLTDGYNAPDADVLASGLLAKDNCSSAWGTDGDIVALFRDSVLAANTALGNALIGTPIAQALAIGSFMLSNVLASGDMGFYVNTGGHSHEFLWADGSADAVTVGHGMATLNLKTTTGDLTIASGASLNVTLNDDDADALDIANSAESYYLIDTRNTVVATVAHTIDTEDATLASAAGAVYGLLSLPAFTLNYTGTTQVTTQIDVVAIGTMSIVGGSAVTVDEANTLLLTAPTEGANTTLTDTAALRLLNSGGTPTNQYGIYIEDLTVGSALDYGIYIAGADSAAIYVASADPIHLGVAGASTGKIEIDGATSGTVTITVATAAGTSNFVLPPDDGDAGEQLQTEGSGITTWEGAASLRSVKDLLGRMNPLEALDRLVSVPVYLFRYKEEAEHVGGDKETLFTGVVADEAPWAMMHKGRIFNPISAFGHTVASIQALYDKIVNLEEKVASLQAV